FDGGPGVEVSEGEVQVVRVGGSLPAESLGGLQSCHQVNPGRLRTLLGGQRIVVLHGFDRGERSGPQSICAVDTEGDHRAGTTKRLTVIVQFRPECRGETWRGRVSFELQIETAGESWGEAEDGCFLVSQSDYVLGGECVPVGHALG